MGANRIRRSLPVQLTEHEVIQASKDLARATQELSKVVNRKKEVNASLAAQQKVAEATIEILALKVSTGEECRDIECEVSINLADNTKTIFRLDTGEIIETTSATQDDLQNTFFEE